MDTLTATALALTAAGITGWTATAAAALRLLRELRTDPMTGLGNRAALARLHRRHRNSTRTVGLLLADLDRFKAINDTHGHDHGNRVLAAVGARLAAAVRPAECAIRLHGDEFAVWLGPTTPDRAHQRAVEISAALAGPVLIEDQAVTVTGSVGAATAAADHPLADLLAAADTAMYATKNARRMQVLPTAPSRTRDQYASA